MKQRFIVEIERPEADLVDARWLTTGIEHWGSHMLKSGDVKVSELPAQSRQWAIRGRICPVNTEVYDGPELGWGEVVLVEEIELITPARRT